MGHTVGSQIKRKLKWIKIGKLGWGKLVFGEKIRVKLAVE